MKNNTGEIITKLVIELMEIGVALRNIHIIGHSLGAQVAGFIGQTTFNRTGQKIHRITGLDPAGPVFVSRPPSRRLSADDADIVVVVHTDGGAFGYYLACGTIDFYVNGGIPIQPGCDSNGTLLNAYRKNHIDIS